MSSNINRGRNDQAVEIIKLNPSGAEGAGSGDTGKKRLCNFMTRVSMERYD